jgi:glycosyltransferase involved in cell wall biosynthesis
MTPLVSVVIPTYNRSRQVQSAIQSVLDQTHSDLEAIVVDDRSIDNTVQVVEEYSRKDPRIRLIVHKERRGAQAARNTGIKAGSGEWIAFLDSDDKWLPDSLNSRLQAADTSGSHVVHSDCYVIDPRATGVRQMGVVPMQGDIYRQLLRKFCPVFPALLVSKEALARIGYLDETIVSWEEWDTAIRLAKYYEFSFVPQATFVYDCSHPDTIAKDSFRTALGYEQVFTKHRRSILHYLGPKTLASHYRKAAKMYRQGNEKVQAYRCLLVAFLLWPIRPGAIFRKYGTTRFLRLNLPSLLPRFKKGR